MKLSLLDLRVWLVAVVLGLAATLAIVTAERGAARTTAEALGSELDRTRTDLEQRTSEAAQAQARAKAAETRLTDYAAETAHTFQQQAEASARVAAELADLNRRVRAASQEITRADPALRLDDPLPRGVRDGLACAGGDDRACVPAAAADPVRVPAGAAKPARPTVPAAGGAERA